MTRETDPSIAASGMDTFAVLVWLKLPWTGAKVPIVQVNGQTVATNA